MRKIRVSKILIIPLAVWAGLLVLATVYVVVINKRVKLNERIEAIRQLTDQTALAKIARNDKKPLVRTVAVGKLNDQTVLAEIAQGDKDWGVRKEAIWGLTDQAVLAEIVKNDKRYDLRGLALSRIHDRARLMEIGRNDKDARVRLMVVNYLGRVILMKRTKNENEEDIRQAKALLAELAEDENKDVRQLAAHVLSVWEIIYEETGDEQDADNKDAE